MVILKDLPPPPENQDGWPWLEAGKPLPEKMPDGTDWPCISIITPSYNQGKYLEETIRSVLLQAYPNLEYIIIDGGSSDSSVDIIRKYGAWITYWESKPDQGQSHAINKGLQRVTGEIVAWINSDDLYSREVFKKIASLYRESSAGFLCAGNCEFVKAAGERLIWKTKIPRLNKLLLHPYIHMLGIIKGSMPPQPSVFIGRELFEKYGLLNESLYYSMDYDLWLRFLAGGEHFIYLDDVLSVYLFHDSSKSAGGFDAFVPEWKKVSREHIRKLPLLPRFGLAMEKSVLQLMLLLKYAFGKICSGCVNKFGRWVSK